MEWCERVGVRNIYVVKVTVVYHFIPIAPVFCTFIVEFLCSVSFLLPPLALIECQLALLLMSVKGNSSCIFI